VKPVYWKVPALWPGETFVLLGGGPSLTQAQVDACRGRARVIAINDQLRLAPWADVHYFCDDKWWRWHKDADWYRGFGGLRITLENLDLCKVEPGMRPVQNVATTGLCAEPNGVMNGRNSGYQCMNLAVHLGAARILLLGFDMRAVVEQRKQKTHWFGDHPGGTSPTVYQVMLDAFPTIVEPLRQRAIDVVNCTPGSALACFRRGNIEDELKCVVPTA
jgi:hypothetical protein